jgi:hypothetical protein
MYNHSAAVNNITTKEITKYNNKKNKKRKPNEKQTEDKTKNDFPQMGLKASNYCGSSESLIKHDDAKIFFDQYKINEAFNSSCFEHHNHHQSNKLVRPSFVYGLQEINFSCFLKPEDIFFSTENFAESKLRTLYFPNYMDGKESLCTWGIEPMDFSEIIMPTLKNHFRKRSEFLKAIAYSVDWDMKQCIMEERQRNESPFSLSNNRIQLNNNNLNTFTFSLFKKMTKFFVQNGVLTELYSELMSSNGKTGLDLMIDFPLSGEDNLKRVIDCCDDEFFPLIRKHTLIFNHSLKVKITLFY